MEFKLTGKQGTVSLIKDDITLEEIKTLSGMVGVADDSPASRNKKASEALLRARVDELKEKADQERARVNEARKRAEAERAERPRRHPLVGSSESEGFPIREIVEEKKSNKKNAKIKCPECEAVTIDTVPPSFKFMKCSKCHTKVFLTANLDKSSEHDLIGTSKFLTHQERVEKKIAEEKASKDELRDKLNGSDFPMERLRAAASLNHFEKYSHLRKSELVDFLIDKGAYLDDEGNLKFPKRGVIP